MLHDAHIEHRRAGQVVQEVPLVVDSRSDWFSKESAAELITCRVSRVGESNDLLQLRHIHNRSIPKAQKGHERTLSSLGF